MATSRRQIIRQIESLEPEIRNAFLSSISDIVSEAEVQRLTGFLLSGDIQSFIDALNLDESVFRDVDLAIAAAYLAGGQFGVDELPVIRRANGVRAVIRFDVRNPRADAWLRQFSSGYITNITQAQRSQIQQVLNLSAQLGRNPRQTALDIIGRINRVTGRREGGLIGLTSQQQQYVINTRRQLASGDPEQLRRYFDRTLRDRRFDGIVNRAITNGRAVNQSDIDRIVARYSDRLLRSRGEAIARTETLAAFNAANDEAFEQAIDTGEVRRDLVIGTWQDSGRNNVRESHKALNGQQQPLGQPFVSPVTGASLLRPGDTSLGAGAEDVANCACIKRNRIDFIAQAV